MSLPALDPARTAVVTIDLHRGHLDPQVATMPLPVEAARRVTARSGEVIAALRDKGIPILHVLTSYTDAAEIAANPWWAAVADTGASRANVLRHQLPGSPGLELMPEVYDADRDVVIDGKRRYDSFWATGLELALRSRGIATVLVMGVNNNSCVLATTVAANARDFAPIVITDCVDTMDRSVHEAALAVIRQAFGWTASGDEILAVL